MSPLVLGVLLFRHIPPPSEGGATTTDLADHLGLPVRNVQRYLAAMERGGLVRHEPAVHVGNGSTPSRWWRA